MKKNWYRIEASTGSIPEILIYGDIADYNIDSATFRRDLFAIKAPEVNVRINSRGGGVFEGIAIHNALRDHPAKITAYIDSLAASIAAYIAMGADIRVMAKASRMMIHEAQGVVGGTAKDLRDTADLLDDANSMQIDAFSTATSLGRSVVKEMLAVETWLTPEQAKKMGFIDVIEGENEQGSRAQFDLSPFKNVPKEVSAAFGKTPTEREVEQLLRDAGVSRKEAMTAVAAIKGEGQRDSDEAEALAKQLLAKMGTSTN